MISETRRASSTPAQVGIASATTFVALAVVVRAGLVAGGDVSVRNWFRPHDVWGPAQLRADVIVEGMRPVILTLVLSVITLIICLVRRSLRPAVVVGGVVLAASVISVIAKWVIARPDPHGAIGVHGGTFPSGHVLTTVVCFGLGVLLLRPVPRWWWLLPALMGCLMTVANLLEAAHWGTDLLGGGLLGAAVLALAVTLGCGPWASGRSRTPTSASRTPSLARATVQSGADPGT